VGLSVLPVAMRALMGPQVTLSWLLEAVDVVAM
jgi:hypothetical protein